MAKNRHRIIPGKNFQAQFAEMRKIQNDMRSEVTETMAVLASEVASRRRDPYEYNYMGVLQNTDPLVCEKASSAYELYGDLMRDGKVFSAYQKRVHTLLARPWQVTPVQESELGTQYAEIVTDILKRVRFDQVCKDLMDALMIGMSVSEIIWGIRDGYVVPERIVKRAQRRFVFKDVEENTPPELRLITREYMQDGVPLPARKFIVHRYGAIDDNPYGQGVGLQLYWPVFFKRCSVVSWNKLNDRFGTPTAWGKYNPGATPEAKTTLMNALKAMSSDGVVMTPSNASIELIQAAMSANLTSHQMLCQYMDNWIAGVLVGENGSENNGGALAAASNERQDLRLDFAQADADLLSDTLNETLIKWICEFNGFEPCQVYRPINEEEDQKALADTYQVVYGLGFKPSLDMIRNQFGDGWEERDMSMQTPYSSSNTGSYLPYAPSHSIGASFAEGKKRDDLDIIDEVVKGLSNDELDKVFAGVLEPFINAVENSKNFEEALAAVQAALPDADPAELSNMLARMMFGSQSVGMDIKQE